MYYNWFTTNFKDEDCIDGNYAGTYECQVTEIEKEAVAVCFRCTLLDKNCRFIINKHRVFATKKEAFEAAKEILKGRIETLNKSITIIDNEIAGLTLVGKYIMPDYTKNTD